MGEDNCCGEVEGQ